MMAQVGKEWYRFYHPMGGWQYDFDCEFEYQVQIGSKIIPEFPVKFAAQAYYELENELGIHSSSFILYHRDLINMFKIILSLV